ncbi:hypothetical protein AYO20_07545 [Fonsecaea nubica]|uniref:Uncharacterized protein n=1 Tax=Fonsecaea nubica TaxID=856822 RepID=A0A178CTQ9_9EURO|nr:hypothetical protein AYO20_07545 [Fonsecaea nubica]OAL33228.1 hypothetical protein AYO20_07545 [Fonsecaea nubica]
MSEAGSYAFVTGGASGIGRALTIALVKEGCQVFIADRDIHSAIDFAAELNETAQVAWTAQVDVTNWDEQVSAFEKAVDTFGRIDYVFPIAGLSERRSFPNRGKDLKGFEKPDLSVIDVNLTGVLYTVSLALQQFRRQDVNKFGFKGKICPAVVRTAMTNAFSDRLEGLGLLTPMSSVVEAFQSMLGSNDVSGECFEAGPKGYKIKSPSDYSDDDMRRTMLMISEKSVSLHEPIKE